MREELLESKIRRSRAPRNELAPLLIPPSPTITFADRSPCYYRNYFFNVDVRAVVEIDSDATPFKPTIVDRYGEYGLASTIPGAHTFTAWCGSHPAQVSVTVPNTGAPQQPSIVFNNRAPILTRLQALVNGSPVAGAPRDSVVTLVAKVSDPDNDSLNFTWGANAGRIIEANHNEARWRLPDSPGLSFAYVLVSDRHGALREGSVAVSTDADVVPAPPASAPPPQPSDHVDAPDHFLTYFSTRGAFNFNTKGADSRLGACRYYADIGAVAGCSAQGEPIGEQLTFHRWKEKWGLDKPGAGFHALYANIRDLDLERDMHAISTPEGVASYVCNYPHVRGGKRDNKLLNVQNDENLVACVAMEYSPTPGVSGGKPFTKFITFGPGGRLLLSVNLDARGEKFVPGSCVVCHGARSEFERYNENGDISPNLGAQFLPFDLGNFEFAEPAGPLSRDAQEDELRNLNLTVLDTNPNPIIKELVHLWYPDPNRSHFTNAIPPGWGGHEEIYEDVVHRYCRTCHVGMGPTADGRDLSFQTFAPFDQWDFEVRARVCTEDGVLRKRWSMPNSKVTFDEFWNDSIAVKALEKYLRSVNNLDTTKSCMPPP